MATQNSAQAKEAEFKRQGINTERQAAMEVALGGMDPSEVRKRLESAGYDAAKDEGINPAHAKTIVDGVLAQFDRDVASSDEADAA